MDADHVVLDAAEPDAVRREPETIRRARHSDASISTTEHGPATPSARPSAPPGSQPSLPGGASPSRGAA